MRSAVVLPTSTTRPSTTWRATRAAVAIQLDAATSSGRARAASTSRNPAAVVKTATPPVAAPETASSTKPTPSRLVRKASDSSAVMVTAVAPAGPSSAPIARSSPGSASFSRQISNGRLRTRTRGPPGPTSTRAALTLAPPTSQPTTAVTVPLLPDDLRHRRRNRRGEAARGAGGAGPRGTIGPAMRIVPVLDLKGGVAVHAVRGQRDAYAPVR